MHYNRLGTSGLKLSSIALGTWATIGERVGLTEFEPILSAAYDLGINYFDTAETYGKGAAEEALGQLLKKLRWPRETFVISGKVYWGTHSKKPNTWGLSRKHIIEGCHATLKRLGLEYLDLFLCHRYDPEVTLPEVVHAMHDLISQGKVLYWGTSEWSAKEYWGAYEYAKANNLHPPVLEQLEYNIFHRDKVEVEFKELYSKAGMGLTIWSPLKSGLLTGKYNKQVLPDTRLGDKKNEWLLSEVFGEHPNSRKEIVGKLTEYAKDMLGTTIKKLSLAWCLKNSNVTSVITGASEISHLHEATEVFDVLGKLTDKNMYDISTIASEISLGAVYEREY